LPSSEADRPDQAAVHRSPTPVWPGGRARAGIPAGHRRAVWTLVTSVLVSQHGEAGLHGRKEPADGQPVRRDGAPPAPAPANGSTPPSPWSPWQGPPPQPPQPA